MIVSTRLLARQKVRCFVDTFVEAVPQKRGGDGRLNGPHEVRQYIPRNKRNFQLIGGGLVLAGGCELQAVTCLYVAPPGDAEHRGDEARGETASH